MSDSGDIGDGILVSSARSDSKRSRPANTSTSRVKTARRSEGTRIHTHFVLISCVPTVKGFMWGWFGIQAVALVTSV